MVQLPLPSLKEKVCLSVYFLSPVSRVVSTCDALWLTRLYVPLLCGSCHAPVDSAWMRAIISAWMSAHEDEACQMRACVSARA